MSVGWEAALLIFGAVAIIVGVVGDMCGEEVRGRLLMLPQSLVRLAVRRLPPHLRAELVDEWGAELEFIVRSTEGLPLTRLWRGIRYAVGLLRGSGVIGRDAEEAAADPADLTVSALLERASGGEQPAWDELVERHANLLWAVARAHRLNPTEAADAVQDTWLRLLEHIDDIDDPERLGEWLIMTLRAESLKRGCHHSRSPSDDVVPDEALDALLVQAEQDAVLWQAFIKLPEQYRRVLRVEMATPPPTRSQACVALGISARAVNRQRSEALTLLRQILLRDPGLPSQLRDEITDSRRRRRVLRART